MAHDATDEQPLLGATAQGRCLFTFTARFFMVFSEAVSFSRWDHSFIAKAHVRIIKALDYLLSETDSCKQPHG
jgi:hypothetical protein